MNPTCGPSVFDLIIVLHLECKARGKIRTRRDIAGELKAGERQGTRETFILVPPEKKEQNPPKKNKTK